MNLFQINHHIARVFESGESVDTATGEFFDDLDALQMDLEVKIENTIGYIKNTEATAKALKEQAVLFAERERVEQNKADRAKAYLALHSEGVSRSYPRTGELKWTKSTRVEVDEGASLDPYFINTKETKTIDKMALKAHLKAGHTIEGVSLVENKNIKIT